MTTEQKRIKIAEACGVADRWVLMKRGFYYRPNAKGYTDIISEAWVISEAEADEHAYPHDEPVTKHRAPLPDYFNDLNACHEMEAWMESNKPNLCLRYGTNLNYVINPDDGIVGVFRSLNATAAQRAEAFGLTLGLWKEGE